MKKAYFLVIFIINICNSQVTFEHTYTNLGDKITNYNSFDFDVIYTQSGLKYVTYNRVNTSSYSSTTEVKIYDENHSLLKTVTCPNLVRVYSITDKLFNSDDNLEILYQSSRYSIYQSVAFYLQDVVLQDENNTILFQASERIGARIYKTASGNYKLIVHTYNKLAYNSDGGFSTIQGPNDFSIGNGQTGAGFITNPYSFDVYGLSGTLSAEQEHQYLKNGMIGYPIPTGDRLSITNKFPLEQDSKLEVYDLNGKKVLEKEVSAGTKDLTIDVSGLTSGTYIYKLNGISSKFIKE